MQTQSVPALVSQPATPAKTAAKAKRAGITFVSMGRFREAARLGPVAAVVYLAQAHGVNTRYSKQQGRPVSNHGANAAHERTDFSEQQCRTALSTLCQHEFLLALERQNGGQLYQPTYVVDPMHAPDIAIEPAFFNKASQDPPGELRNLKILAYADPMHDSALVLRDSLSLFLELHSRQDLDGWGGVDPAAVYGLCSPIAPEEDGAGTCGSTPVTGNHAWTLLTTVRPQRIHLSDSLIKNSMQYVRPDVILDIDAEARQRADRALEILNRAGLVDEVVTVWKRASSVSPEQLIYTLFDPTLPNGGKTPADPCLQTKIRELCRESGVLSRDAAFNPHHPEYTPHSELRRSHALVPSAIAGQIEVRVQLRARRWGATSANLKAFQADRQRSRDFYERLLTI